MARKICKTPDCGNVVLGITGYCRGCKSVRHHARKNAAKIAALPQDTDGIAAYASRRGWRVSPDLGGAAWIHSARGDVLGCGDTLAEALKNAVSGQPFGAEA